MYIDFEGKRTWTVSFLELVMFKMVLNFFPYLSMCYDSTLDWILFFSALSYIHVMKHDYVVTNDIVSTNESFIILHMIKIHIHLFQKVTHINFSFKIDRRSTNGVPKIGSHTLNLTLMIEDTNKNLECFQILVRKCLYLYYE